MRWKYSYATNVNLVHISLTNNYPNDLVACLDGKNLASIVDRFLDFMPNDLLFIASLEYPRSLLDIFWLYRSHLLFLP